MSFKRIHQPRAKNSQKVQNSSVLKLRSLAAQSKPVSENPAAQEKLENQALDLDQIEAIALKNQKKYGTNSAQEERLGIEQAQMNEFLVQKMEKASRLSHNLANISIYYSPAAVERQIQLKPVISQPTEQYEEISELRVQPTLNNSSESQNETNKETSSLNTTLTTDQSREFEEKDSINVITKEQQDNQDLEGLEENVRSAAPEFKIFSFYQNNLPLMNPTIQCFFSYSPIKVNDDKADGKFKEIQDEYKNYNKLLQNFWIGGGEQIDQLLLNNSTEDYISQTIFPKIDAINNYAHQYLNQLKQLKQSENFYKRVWHKLKPNEKIQNIKGAKDFIVKDVIEKIPDEKKAVETYVKNAVSKRALTRPKFLNQIKGRKQRIENYVKLSDPEVAKLIKNTEEGIKKGGEIKKPGKSLSGAYLVPEGFFKPMSQAPGQFNFKAGYQTIRELLAYELSKYMKTMFDKDLGIGKTGLASFESEKLAFRGQNWRNDFKKDRGKDQAAFLDKREVKMPEQIGSWHELIDIDKENSSSSWLTGIRQQDQLQSIAFFDLMSGNYDRHKGNLVMDKQGNLRPIDQGEIIPDFDLHKMRTNSPKSDASSYLAWSNAAVSNQEFSKDFQQIAAQIDPDQVINHLKAKVDEYKKIAPEVVEGMINDESWELLKLHILALKKGIEEGLSIRNLAEIFMSKEIGSTFIDIGQERKESNSSVDFGKAQQKIADAFVIAQERLLDQKYAQIQQSLKQKISQNNAEKKSQGEKLLSLFLSLENEINKFLEKHSDNRSSLKYKNQLFEIKILTTAIKVINNSNLDIGATWEEAAKAAQKSQMNFFSLM